MCKTGWQAATNYSIPSCNKHINRHVAKSIKHNGSMIKAGHMKGCYKTRNGWYLVLVAPIFTIVGLLILYS